MAREEFAHILSGLEESLKSAHGPLPFIYSMVSVWRGMGPTWALKSNRLGLSPFKTLLLLRVQPQSTLQYWEDIRPQLRSGRSGSLPGQAVPAQSPQSSSSLLSQTSCSAGRRSLPIGPPTVRASSNQHTF